MVYKQYADPNSPLNVWLDEQHESLWDELDDYIIEYDDTPFDVVEAVEGWLRDKRNGGRNAESARGVDAPRDRPEVV